MPPAGWGNSDGGYVQAPWHHRSGEVSGSGPGRRSVPVNGSGGPGAEPVPFFFPPGGGDRFTIGRTRDCDLCLTDLSVSRLHAELVKIIGSPESLERLASVGAFPVANTPEQFAEFLRLDVAKWAKVIKEHGIKAD